METAETLRQVDPNSPEAVGRLGDQVYETHVRPKLRPEDAGRFVAIDVDSGDFAFLHPEHSPLPELLARWPAARVWVKRIGGPAAGDRNAADMSRMEFKRIAKLLSRGEAAYESHVRPQLRPEDEGQFVAIDAETGDFEIHSNGDRAIYTLRERRPTANIWIKQVGRATIPEMPRVEAAGS